MNIIVVYNPKSDSALSTRELTKKCTTAGIEIEAFIPTGDGFETKLKKHVENGKYIAAVGGDGTISAVAGQVANTKATLIPLPGGTLNHFTKDLGIPQDIDEALARLVKAKPRTIDIAQVNDTYFINNSSIGIYPETLRDREETESMLGKWPAAVLASFRAIVKLRTYTVTIDGKTVTTPFVFVCNNRYSIHPLGGTERSSLDEGLLTVFVAKTQSRLKLIAIAALALIGKTKQLPDFDIFHPKSLTIQTKREQISVSHDGEVSNISYPLTYKICPKALRILG